MGFRLFLIVLACAPAAILPLIAFQYAVDIPFWDEYGTVIKTYKLAVTNKLSLDFFFSQHNEARLAFPRIVWWIMSYMPTGDHRYTLVLAFITASLASLLLYTLMRRTLPADPMTHALLWLYSNLIIFNPNQFENWLWGEQFYLFVPATCLLAGLAVCAGKASVGTRTLSCGVASAIAMYSFPSGLVVWPLLGVALYASGRPEGTRLGKWLVAYVLLMTGGLAMYFAGYHTPGHHPPWILALSQPMESRQYLSGFLGNPLASGAFAGIVTAQTLGILIMVMLAAVVIAGRCWLHVDLFSARVIPWLLVSAYSVANAAISTGGRVGFGVDQSLSPRYITISLWASIGVVFIGYGIYREIVAHGRTLKISKAIPITICVVFLLLTVSQYPASVRLMDDYVKIPRLRARAAVSLIDVLPVKKEDLCTICPTEHEVKTLCRFIMEHGYSALRIHGSKELSLIEQTLPDRRLRGQIRSLQLRPDGELLISGLADIPGRKRPPECLLFSYRDDSAQPLVFDYLMNRSGRAPVTPFNKAASPFRVWQWTHAFPLSSLPLSAKAIGIWGYDGETLKLTFSTNRDDFVLIIHSIAFTPV